MIQHNVLHQFAEGLNNDSGTNWPAVPFQTPGQRGWKIVYEPFGEYGLTAADNVQYESVVETSGTTTWGVNGALITTNGSDNSSGWFGWTTPNVLIGAATKKFYLETSFILTAATMASNEMFIGFSSDQSTTAFVAAAGTSWAFDDGFGFGKLDAATELDFISRQSDVEQTVALTVTPTTAVKMKLGCYYDGTKFNVYKDDVLLSSTARSTLNTDAAMGVVTYCKDGAGEAQTLTTHYVLLATEL